MKDPTCTVRLLADTSACKYADRHGDALFRREVDGVVIPAVTHWFYGLSLPDETQHVDWTKTFSVADMCLLEEVRKRAKDFLQSVPALPYIALKTLTREGQKIDRLFTKAQVYVQNCSPIYCGYLCLLHRLPAELARKVISFTE